VFADDHDLLVVCLHVLVVGCHVELSRAFACAERAVVGLHRGQSVFAQSLAIQTSRIVEIDEEVDFSVVDEEDC